MTHTPGPWREKPDSRAPTGHSLRIVGPDNQFVAVVTDIMVGKGDDDEANAKLIAAAPDLLKALEGMLVNPNYYRKKARDAIEEAKK